MQMKDISSQQKVQVVFTDRGLETKKVTPTRCAVCGNLYYPNHYDTIDKIAWYSSWHGYRLQGESIEFALICSICSVSGNVDDKLRHNKLITITCGKAYEGRRVLNMVKGVLY